MKFVFFGMPSLSTNGIHPQQENDPLGPLLLQTLLHLAC